MPSSLPHLLTERQLPTAELDAARLDGDVVRLDRVFCSIAELDLPWRRASALGRRDGVAPGTVVGRLAAAWVWGAVGVPPDLVDVVSRGALVRLGAADRVDFGALAVTSPARTIVDLLRCEAPSAETLRVASRVAAEQGVDRVALQAALGRATHLPFRSTAARFVGAVTGRAVVGRTECPPRAQPPDTR